MDLEGGAESRNTLLGPRQTVRPTTAAQTSGTQSTACCLVHLSQQHTRVQDGAHMDQA